MDTEKRKITKFVNIGVLDIRNAGDKDLGIVEMVNVGYILHTPKTFNLLKEGKRINVGQYIEANPEARVLLAATNFSDEYFSQQDSGLELLAFAPIMVDWETTPETIEKGLTRLDVFGGPLICPRHLLSTLQSRIKHQDADTIAFESATARIVMGKLVLDEVFLDSLEDGTELIVVGTLKVPEVLPNDVLKQKVKRLYVQGRVTCHEENAGMIQSILSPAEGKMKVIPAGYELVEKPLAFNNLVLESLQTRKIYCNEWVQIASDVSPDLLDEKLEALISDERIYCPEGLKDVIVKKSDWRKTNVELYTGELWIIDDARELPSYAFDHIDGVATLVILGELALDPQIAPETLTKRLAKVHNLGSIICTPEQMGAIQSLLGLSEGEWSDSTKPPKIERDEPEIDVIKEAYVNARYVSL